MQSDQERIVDYLRNKEPVSTLDIAKHIYGSKATTKQINPTLYRMSDKIVKTCDPDGTKPRWSLK